MFLISLDFELKLSRDSEIPKDCLRPNILGNSLPPPHHPSGAIFLLPQARMQEYFIFMVY